MSFYVCGWAYPLPLHLCWNAVPIDPKTLSMKNVEENCLSLIGHVTSDEKYECVIWNDLMICSRTSFGSVYYESLRGPFLGNLYLYRWYNHTTSVSNDCLGGYRLCGLLNAFWYCFHHHFNLYLRMVIKWWPSLS